MESNSPGNAQLPFFRTFVRTQKWTIQSRTRCCPPFSKIDRNSIGHALEDHLFIVFDTTNSSGVVRGEDNALHVGKLSSWLYGDDNMSEKDLQTFRLSEIEPGLQERVWSYLRRVRTFCGSIYEVELRVWPIIANLLGTEIILPNVRHLALMECEQQSYTTLKPVAHVLSPTIDGITFINGAASLGLINFISSNKLPHLIALWFKRYEVSGLDLVQTTRPAFSKFRHLRYLAICSRAPTCPNYFSELSFELSKCESLEQLDITIEPPRAGEMTPVFSNFDILTINPPNLRDLAIRIHYPTIRLVRIVPNVTKLTIAIIPGAIDLQFLLRQPYIYHLETLAIDFVRKVEGKTFDIPAFSLTDFALWKDRAESLKVFRLFGAPFALSAKELIGLIDSWPSLYALFISDYNGNSNNTSIRPISSEVLTHISSRIPKLTSLALPLDFTFLKEPLDVAFHSSDIRTVNGLTELRLDRWEGIPEGPEKMVVLNNLKVLFPNLRRISAFKEAEHELPELNLCLRQLLVSNKDR
ncbi:hypothetical protein NP233_g11744 [Leucocoprinus birnbaumii]|uniref:Uncharacterized protein n=1 Tax=Leucocoprinus birnbaumii TaxID=56174 RepID=A0AAD5VLM0_9AGAR|nr:hypothetical protein NP233_g11744 [Leucocoprinus birnbaumii]